MVQQAIYDKLDILQGSFFRFNCDFLIYDIVLADFVSIAFFLVLLLPSACFGRLDGDDRTRLDIISSEKILPEGLFADWSLSLLVFPRKVVPQTPILN